MPLYYLCNRNGDDGKRPVFGDFFYLFVVQGGFGFSNGVLGSSCMMTAGLVGNDGGEEEVAEMDGDGGQEGEGRRQGQQAQRGKQKEAAGGWMSLMLVVGLSVGSLMSFAF